MSGAEDPTLDVLLDHLKRSRGFDFGGYKRSSLERRIAKRMEAIGVDGYTDYLDHLEVHPDEFPKLFNTILINVTSFFRDGAAWDFMAEELIPKLLDRKAPDGSIRIWSAGCASGEETYTMAILLAEAMGERSYADRVKIYATDVDEEALDQARQGVYSAKAIESVPERLRERFFDPVDQRWVFRKDLRRTVIFGRNDLVQDAPISRVDLLLCRNTLMYFNAETQAQILRRFHFALDPAGHLLLGKSEMLITHSDLFAPTSLKHRVFSKVRQATLRDRLLTATNVAEDLDAAGAAIGETAFDAAPVAQLVVGADGTLLLANGRARTLLRLTPGDAGRELKDLEVSYRPVELRSSLDDALRGDRTITVHGVSLVTADQETLSLDVTIAPLHDHGTVIGASITYDDMTVLRTAQDDAERARSELSSAYEELQSTVEELETTNEELQSTNEELETTNEELQSTNEELETMNEELQSTNEELETMNDELRKRTLELNDVNAFMETILETMGVAVIVIDREQRIRVWNSHSFELWGVRREEAEGEHLLNLDIGLGLGQLKQPVRAALAGEAESETLTLPATDRRGRAFSCQVSVLPLSMGRDGVSGAILLLERQDGSAAAGSDGQPAPR